MLKWLKSRARSIAAIAILFGYVAALWAWRSHDFPTGFYDQCQYAAAYNQDNDCSPYNVYLVALREIGEALSNFGFWNSLLTLAATIVTAFATAYIARFTKTLYLVSRDQLALSHEVERAYVTIGGAPQVQIAEPTATGAIVFPAPPTPARIPTGAFQFTLSNNGKTPGEVWQIGFGFCDANNVPRVPQYAIRRWHQWVGPGIKDEPLVVPYAMPKIEPTAVYARVFYRDIFGGRHSSGFMHLVDRNFGTSEPWPAPAAYTEERDEP
jgi:hypothetical protein